MRVYTAMNMVQSCCFNVEQIGPTLKLRRRQGFEGGAVDCLLCGGEEETLRHFVVECRELQEIRRYGVAYMEPKHWRRF